MGEGDSVKVEFYGGPWDGEVKHVGTSQHEYFIPKPVAGPIVYRDDEEAVPEVVPLIVHVYEKRAFKGLAEGKVQLRMVYRGERER